MYVVTNRNLQEKEPAKARFGNGFNVKGPHELTAASIRKQGKSWEVEVVDVVDRCLTLEDLYGVVVVAFTWPSEGGGAAAVTSYMRDKQTARLSVTALDRTLEGFHRFIKKLAAKDCAIRLSLALHSMGNYLLQKLTLSSVYQGETILFDNITMLAPDVNNERHADWMGKLEFGRRLFVLINEDDRVLLASRLKTGQEQQARLGHFPYDLDCTRAVYVDVTHAKGVEGASLEASHAYFVGDAAKSQKLKAFFRGAFNGEAAEAGLPYDAGRKLYALP